MADPRPHVYANNATALLAENLTSDETSIQVEAGKGALFPAPGVGEIFVCTLEHLLTGVREIMHCTARAGDVLTVERGQEDTVAIAWTQGSNVILQNRVTAGTLEHLEETGGGEPEPTSEPVVIQVACSDLTTALTVGAGKGYVRAPRAFTLTEVRASLFVVSSSGLVTVTINKNGVAMLSTPITIDANEKTSETAAAPAVIGTSAVADDDELAINITAAGTGAKGLVVTLIGTP
jgi:hypothetical protein